MWLQEKPDKRKTAHIPDPEKANYCVPKAEKTSAHETAAPRFRATQPVGQLGENKDIPDDDSDNKKGEQDRQTVPKEIVSKSLMDKSSDSGDRAGTNVITASEADHGVVGFNLVRTAWAAGDILLPVYTIASGLVICLFCDFGILCLCRGRCGCWRLSGRGDGRFGTRRRVCLNP